MTQPKPDDIARALIASPNDPAALADARDAAHRGESRDVVLALVKAHEAGGDPRTVAIKDTMTLLERLMDVDAEVAGSAMAELYWPASDAFLHEVCDAIDLWFDASKDPALAKALRAEAARAGDTRRKRRLEDWAKDVEKNLAP
jgi:hypothetical protein